MKITSYFWNVEARYSINHKSFRLTIPLFNGFSKVDDYRYSVSVNPVSNELVIDAIKNMDIHYKNGESRESSASKYESDRRTELS
jgi:hypothetical protein